MLSHIKPLPPAPRSPDTIADCPAVPMLPPRPVAVREARCQRAAKRMGGMVLRRRSVPGVYAVLGVGGGHVDIDIDEVEAILFG